MVFQACSYVVELIGWNMDDQDGKHQEVLSEHTLADTVWHRVVQICQEAMLTGVDCTDLLRQVRLVPTEADKTVLTLSPGYLKQVRASHEKMLVQARELAASHDTKRFIIPDDEATPRRTTPDEPS